jgi:predicted ATPase
MPMWLAFGAFHDGWLRWHAGDQEQGAAQMRSGLGLMHEQGISTVTPLYGVLQAEALAEVGQYDLAITTVHSELKRISETGEHWFLAEAERVLGEILLASQRNAEGAEAAFMRAIDVARNQSAKQFERLAASGLARLWARQGRRVDSQGPLSSLAPVESSRSAGLRQQDT